MANVNSGIHLKMLHEMLWRYAVTQMMLWIFSPSFSMKFWMNREKTKTTRMDNPGYIGVDTPKRYMQAKR